MIKKILKSVREYKIQSILAPIFVSVEVVLEVLIPILMAKLIDYGIEADNIGNVYKIGALIVLCSLTSLCFGVLSGKMAAIAGAGFAKNIRHDMFYSVQDLSFINIDKFSTAGIITRLTTDVTRLQNAYQMIIRIMVRSPLMLIFSIIAAFTIDNRLALVFVIAIPFLAIGLFGIIKIVHPIFEKVMAKYDELNNIVQEDLRGIRVVKSFIRENHEIKKFDKINNEIYEDFTKAEKLIALNSPLMQCTSYFCMLSIAWVGAHFIVQNTLTKGELMSMLTYTMQILMSLMMLSMIFVMLTISRASCERIAELLEEKSTICSPENAVKDVKDGSVEFKNVGFSYEKNGRKCLRDINLKIDSGQTIGIIGGTGSAKSTLVALIPRLYDASEGEILVGGIDVRKYDLTTLRDAVSMVLQKNVLFAGTIKENLKWGNNEATDEQIIEACKICQADEFIKSFTDGYDTFIEQGGSNVSGGQKQRLCIARALLKKPKILILDDSTSAVDTATDALIQKGFREKIPNTTKIIIAQRISSVMNANKIIVLEDGIINGIGTHESLLETNEIYRDIYESQQKGGLADADE